MAERIDDILKKQKWTHQILSLFVFVCSVFVNCRFDINMYLTNKYFYMSYSLV